MKTLEEIKIDSKAKFIKEYMNDHNGGTPRWLRGIFMDEEEKIQAILNCMDNLEKAISQSEEELVDKVIELSSKYWIDKYVGTEMPLIVNKVQFKKFILEDLNKK